MVSKKQAIMVGLAVFLVASCSGDDEGAEETSSTLAPGSTITTLAAAEDGTQDTVAGTSTTTTTTTTEAPELTFPEYRIVSREATDNGDVVVVLLDPTTYESLSDIDVYYVMDDLVDRFAPVFEAHVVETQAAADALFVEEPTEDQQTALDNDYIARLEEGFRIVYVGPLEASGVIILGS